MSRTYTGPTLGGGIATITCPDWCVDDHEFWGDRSDDLFHHSAPAEIAVPDSVYPSDTPQGIPQLRADLMVHGTDMRPCAATIHLVVDTKYGGSIDLDVAATDALLSELDEYRARLLTLREMLAAEQKARRGRY